MSKIKRFHLITAMLITGGVAAFKLTDREQAERTKAAEGVAVRETNIENKSIENKIIASNVYAHIRYNSVLYTDENMQTPIDYLKAGDRVELLRDKAREKYLICHGGRLGWVEGAALNIPTNPKTVESALSTAEIEQYAVQAGFESETDFFVWVDIARQRTYILKYDNGSLRLFKRLICATGNNESPTTRGHFVISERGESFYNEKLKSGAKYWVRFNGSYLFHSIALNKDGTVKDSTLGERCSDGCVRHSMEDARWFYDNIPEGTGIYIN
jgi:hypothetical protein